MKTKFSTHWNSSKQPRKQRKYIHNAPLHVRGKFLAGHLSTELRAKHQTRCLRIRTGDEIKVMRGQYAGKTGKVERIDSIRTRVFVAGIDQAKRDGTKKLYPLQPSNLLLIKLIDDKKRLPVKEVKEEAATKKQGKTVKENKKVAP